MNIFVGNKHWFLHSVTFDQFKQFITINPDSQERVELEATVDSKSLAIDSTSETHMIELVNKERTKQGLAPLISSVAMQDIAREYSKKMLLEGYVSHVDTQGNDTANRLTSGNVQYRVAGENLAYAKNVTVAHSGLMGSPLHKQNILDPSFKRIGIGVIDAGEWGKMFTQIFAD